MTNSNGYFIHNTIDGDRWDLLAYRYYGDQHKQTVLLEANRDLFVDQSLPSPDGQSPSPPLVVVPPMILPSGLALKVPVIDDSAIDESNLPPWKRTVPEYGT